MSTLQEAVGVASQPDCQVPDTVSHKPSMPVSVLSHQDSTVCDSGSESMGFSDTDNEIGSSIKQTLLNIKALNGEADSINKSKGQSQPEEETNGVTRLEKKDTLSESSPLVVLSEEDSQQEDQEDKSSEEEEEEEKLRREIEDERLLTVGKEELSSEAPVNEDEEFRLLMDVDEEEAQDKITLEQERDTDVAEPNRVASPVSDNGSSQSSIPAEQAASSKLSDSESVSSNISESKKHPLFIGKNVKYSFKGIMTTAVKRVSNDSDSVQSLSPRPEENSKPDSSAGSNSLSEVTDLPADSSTMPDERNLFEKLSFLTDSGKEETDVEMDQESNSQISTSKGNAGPEEGSVSNEQSERTNLSGCSVDEPMETDSPKAATDDENSTLSAVSSTSADPKEQPSCPKEKVTTLTSEKDTSVTSLVKGTNSDASDKQPVSQTSRSRSQSPAGDACAFGENKSVGPPLKCVIKGEIGASEVECDSRHSSDAEVSGGQDSVCDFKEGSKDPNLLHKVIEPKIKRSSEANLLPESGGKVKCEELKTESSLKQCVEGGEGEPSDRKRSAVEDSEHSQPKRSRLDLVIGKLGSQIGISPENIKCDESMFDSDIESGKTSSDSTENRSEEITSEDDEAVSKTYKRLTEESLEEMIKQKIKQVLEQQKEMLTKQFQEKIIELQTSNEAWKSQAKELHRQAVELMSHQQRQERRRAVRVCGQRRNVGIQVGEDRINSVNQQTTSKMGVTSPSQTLPQTALTNPTPVSLLTSKPMATTIAGVNQPPTNQVLVQRMPMPTSANRKDAVAPTVKSILNSNRIGQLSGPSSQPVTQATLTQANKTAVTKVPGSQAIGATGQAQGIQTLVKVIDLTSDEENSSAKGGSPRSVVGQSLLGQSVFRPATSAGLQPGTRILLTPGTRAPGVTNQTALTTSQPRQPGVQYQYLYAPSNQAVSASNVVTLVSPPAGSNSTGARPSAPAPPQLTRPSQPTVSRPAQTTPSARVPPPLQSAPVKAATSTSVAVKDKPESKEASSEGDKSTRKSPELSKHPAPLPPPPANQDMSLKKKALPPKPGLKISRVSQGIVLSWNMLTSSSHAEIASYQLFAYQETSAPVSTLLWKKVGDVKALPLPMACTLTQFQEGNKYHFAVRAVDVHGRMSAFSDPSTIHLVVQNSK